MFPMHISLPLLEAFGDFADIAKSKIALVQADGSCPHVARMWINLLPSDDDLEALGYRLDCSTSLHRSGSIDLSRFYVHDEGHCLYLERSGRNEIGVSVAAKEAEIANAELGRIAAGRVEEGRTPDPDLVHVYFNWYGSNGARERRRDIESPAWEAVLANYAPSTRSALERLHTFTPEIDGVGGRLVMFHGDPGTGKTTAVRSLARSWAPWCTTSYVMDPETLFNVPEYLIEIGVDTPGRRRSRLSFLDRDDDADETTENGDGPWKLIVIEDVDELIRADAKVRTGQALSRLLNMTDGLMGQGLRTLFLLTTNEPMSALHPAISRPGRCLANIEFSKFTRNEAAVWLRGTGATVEANNDAYTLAELYALSSGGVISAENRESVHRAGTYL